MSDETPCAPRARIITEPEFFEALEALEWHVCLDCAVQLRTGGRPAKLPPPGDGSACAMCGLGFGPARRFRAP